MGTPVVPDIKSKAGKKEQVAAMFNNIAHRYDFLNHFFSLGIDKIWRRKAINLLKKENPQTILDVATGTGDFAIAAMKLHPQRINGIDISEKMLEIGREKIKNKKLEKIIELSLGDSENIKFPDNTFDAVTVAFGVRNFENLELGLKEINRVLKKNGTLVVLEFSQPKKFPVKQLYKFYFSNILPFFGKLISKDSSAYTYLPESVIVFPYGEKFLELLQSTGFSNTYCKQLSFGISSIYTGKKV